MVRQIVVVTYRYLPCYLLFLVETRTNCMCYTNITGGYFHRGIIIKIIININKQYFGSYRWHQLLEQQSTRSNYMTRIIVCTPMTYTPMRQQQAFQTSLMRKTHCVLVWQSHDDAVHSSQSLCDQQLPLEFFSFIFFLQSSSRNIFNT